MMRDLGLAFFSVLGLAALGMTAALLTVYWRAARRPE